jgi:hypothetical protein
VNGTDDNTILLNLLGSMRGFLVQGMSNLVLLRATDTPFHSEQNSARMQGCSISTALSMVAAGLNKIQQLAKESNGVVTLQVSEIAERGK